MSNTHTKQALELARKGPDAARWRKIHGLVRLHEKTIDLDAVDDALSEWPDEDRSVLSVARSPALTLVRTIALHNTNRRNLEDLSGALQRDEVQPRRLFLKGDAMSGEWLARLLSLPGARFLESLTVHKARLKHTDAAPLMRHPVVAQLDHLDLSENKLGDRGVETLAAAALAKLQHLRLDTIQVGDEGANAIASAPWLAGLRTLDLNGNRLSEEAVVALLTSQKTSALCTLRLGSTKCQAVAMDALCTSTMGALEELCLDGWKLKGPRIDRLAEAPLLRSLRRLSLEGCGLKPKPLAVLMASAPDGLRSLNVASNRLTNAGLAVLAETTALSSLTELNLRKCHAGAEGVRALATSPHLSSLRFLGLGDNAIGDEGLAALAESVTLTSVKELRLTRCGIGPAGIEAWCGSACHQNVDVLDLSGNGIGDEGARRIAQTPRTSEFSGLTLSGPFDDETLCALGTSPHLRTFDREHWLKQLPEHALGELARTVGVDANGTRFALAAGIARATGSSASS